MTSLDSITNPRWLYIQMIIQIPGKTSKFLYIFGKLPSFYSSNRPFGSTHPQLASCISFRWWIPPPPWILPQRRWKRAQRRRLEVNRSDCCSKNRTGNRQSFCPDVSVMWIHHAWWFGKVLRLLEDFGSLEGAIVDVMWLTYIWYWISGLQSTISCCLRLSRTKKTKFYNDSKYPHIFETTLYMVPKSFLASLKWL